MIKYIASEKYWLAPELNVKHCGLGEAILKNLQQSDPEKVYEILHDNGTHVTVKEIHNQTITVAQNFINLGVQKDDKVVFFTFLNLKITPLTFACYTIGAPVCFFETYLEEELIPEYLVMLDPAVIIYEEKFKSMVLKGLKTANLKNLKHILSLDGIERDQKTVEELLFRPIVDIANFQIPNIGDPKTQPAVFGFTSGSTGKPKIIIQSHSIMREGVYSRWQAKPGSVVMILSEIRWLCQVSVMMQPAFLDVKRVYSSTPPVDLTGQFVMEIIDTNKVTHYFEVPKFYRTVLEAAEQSQDPSSLSSLRLALLGGESVGEAFETYLRKITPNCQIGRSYGMTEMAGNIASSELLNNKNINGGILRNGSRVKIIDKDKQSLGPNQMGLVCLKCSAPFLGYLRNKKANEETFIEGGWLNTGDLGMFDLENLLHIFAREKYVLRGADGKVLLPNVVENIVDKFEGVHSSVLMGRPSEDNRKGDCGTIFVVLKNNSNSIYADSDLKCYLRKHLTPEHLEVVKYIKVIEDLPRTSCFKVDRLALKEMFDGGYRI